MAWYKRRNGQTKVPVNVLDRNSADVENAFLPLILGTTESEIKLEEVFALVDAIALGEIPFVIADFRNGVPTPPFSNTPEAIIAARTIGIGRNGINYTFESTTQTHPSATWQDFDNPKWEFEQTQQLPQAALQTGDFYYIPTAGDTPQRGKWYLWDGTKIVVYDDVNTFLPGHHFLGNFTTADAAAGAISAYDSNTTYLAYFPTVVAGRSGREVQQLVSYKAGKIGANRWVPSDEELHHLISQVESKISDEANRITANQNNLATIERRVRTITTPLRFTQMPTHIETDELIVVTQESFSGTKTYEFAGDTAVYNTVGEYFEYWGYNTRNFGAKLPAFGRGGPSIFRDDRIVALMQVQSEAGTREQKVQLITRTGLLNTDSLAGGNTKLSLRIAQFGNLDYTLQASTFADTGAATRTVSGQSYSIYEVRDAIPYNIFETTFNNADSVSFQISQLISGKLQYFSDDASKVWLEAIEHTTGMFMGDENKRPVEVEIKRKPLVVLPYSRTRGPNTQQGGLLATLPENWLDYSEVFLIYESSSSTEVEWSRPTSYLNVGDLPDESAWILDISWVKSTRQILDGGHESFTIPRIIYLELR